jgi:hypothetical protein
VSVDAAGVSVDVSDRPADCSTDSAASCWLAHACMPAAPGNSEASSLTHLV